MEISGPGPVGTLTNSHNLFPVHKPVEVERIEPGKQSDHARADTHARQAPREPPSDNWIDPDLPAGPPPTFEVTLLEVESDLQQIIARLEAARNQASDAKGIALPETTEVDTAAQMPEMDAQTGERTEPAPYDKPALT